MTKRQIIKNVAIYLRKSRDEGEYDDVLSKHRDTLVAIAESNNWSYQLYEEIGSGESIEKRKKMQKLLVDVKNGMYDGVLVMDIDRLGRGNHSDWADICKAFLFNDTYIITPQKTYDLSQEQDEMLFDFQAVFAKMEYKMIKKRMKQGKVAGAKKGMWTNGRPPYPYIYNKVTRKVEIDTDKHTIYRSIIEKYIAGTNLQQLAIWLNRNNIAPPYSGKRNKQGWSHVSIHRLLVSEIHLGYIIYGKTRTNRGTAEIVDKDEWIKEVGNHEPVKTQEEHDQILARLAKNKLIPQKCRVGVLPLSGLLYCAKCGRRMQFKCRETKSGTLWTALCVYTFPDGTKCHQPGRKLDDAFYKVLNHHIVKLNEDTLAMVEETNEQHRELTDLLALKEKELVQLEQAMERLFELYEDGTISKQRFSDRMAGHEKNKAVIAQEIETFRLALSNMGSDVTVVMVQERIDEFKELWQRASSPGEQNRAYRLLIEKILYNREENGVRLEVLYR